MTVPSIQDAQKNLIVILAREFASKLATSTFVADAAGTLVYFNEAAEALLGRSFAETGEVPLHEWAGLFELEEDDGTAMPPERRPGATVLRDHRPVHRDFSMTTLDGVKRRISATAFPLFSHPGELAGIMSAFWERPGE